LKRAYVPTPIDGTVGRVYEHTMKFTALLSIVFVACVGCEKEQPTVPVMPTACTPGANVGSANDQDADGLDDAMELAWAQQYLPYLSISPDDGCPVAGIVARVTPHPTAAGFVQIRYDVLYNDDCGFGGHIGDDERFATTIDPSMPAPDGIVAIKAISHKGSLCEKTSECGRCPGQAACQTLIQNGTPWPAVWASRSKHGNYVDRSSTCQFDNTCLDQCDDRSMPAQLAILNVGEPCAHLVSNLTTQGFITIPNGWTNQSLFNYEPWGGQPFGEAGIISEDLTDPAFDTPACP
jgi:hypothetical protein